MENKTLSKEKPQTNKIPQTIVSARLKALILDGALSLLVAIILNLSISYIVATTNTTYKKDYLYLTNQVEASALADVSDGSTYTVSELTTNKCDKFLDVVKTFYVDFMSENKNTDDHNTYDINYLNTEILKVGEKDYFVYKMAGETPLTNEVAVVNESLLVLKNEVYTVTENSDLWNFVSDTYNNAISAFNNLDSVIAKNNEMTLINSIIKASSYIVSFLLFFAVIPSLFKETLGKKFFKIQTYDADNNKASTAKLFLRTLPGALVLGIYSFVTDANISSTIFSISIAVGIGFIVFSKSHKAIHDYLANTHVDFIDSPNKENETPVINEENVVEEVVEDETV